MTVATEGYMSPSLYSPSNMFATPGRNLAKSNEIFKTFGNGATNTRNIDPQQMNKHIPRNGNAESMSAAESSFFDFDPPANPGSPFQDQFSTPGASGMPWVSDTTFHPLSPPGSASFSPKDPWAYPYQHQNLPNLFTNIDPASTRTQYGQVTPPNDEDDNISLLDFGLDEQQQHQQVQAQQAGLTAKKRKLNSLSGMSLQSTQPAKRSRKYNSRNSNCLGATDKPEDVKRSKFLERNRVAASKCRQKKKEWTQNLENRARDLHKNNNMLRMNVESLRQEILFLKGELLKHSSCGCEQIQSFIKSGTNNFLDTVDEDVNFKREQSPVESRPGSPESQEHSSLHDSDNTAAISEQTDTSIVNDENALEALLSSSISHDTSDEKIASQVAG